jgi:hypothetical protein
MNELTYEELEFLYYKKKKENDDYYKTLKETKKSNFYKNILLYTNDIVYNFYYSYIYKYKNMFY